MKAIVLENGFERDVPEQLMEHLKENKISWELFDMREKFWPKNRKATFEFFSNLPKGQLIFCQTVFVEFQQLELMIELLHKLKDKNFTIKMVHGCLAESLLRFYDQTESSITPSELNKELEKDLTNKQAKVIFKKIDDFKKEINKKFLEVSDSHNIYWIRWDEKLFKTLDD